MSKTYHPKMIAAVAQIMTNYEQAIADIDAGDEEGVRRRWRNYGGQDSCLACIADDEIAGGWGNCQHCLIQPCGNGTGDDLGYAICFEGSDLRAAFVARRDFLLRIIDANGYEVK